MSKGALGHVLARDEMAWVRTCVRQRVGSSSTVEMALDHGILVPTRLYLDTNHIIEICHLRQGRSRQSLERQQAYQRILDAVVSGACTVLFNPAASLEWVEGERPEKPWEDFIDFFEIAHSVLEVESGLAYTIELLNQSGRILPALAVPQVDVLRPVLEISPAMLELAKHHPDFLQEQYHLRVQTAQRVPKNQGIREWVNGSIGFAKRRPESMRERIEGWKAAMADTLSFIQQRGRRVDQETFITWAKRAHRLEAILNSSSPGVDLAPLWRRLTLDQCPLCSAYLNALPHYLAHVGTNPDENDADDWLAVPAMLLADYALVEKRMRHYLVSGSRELNQKIFRSPEELIGVNPLR